MALSDVQIEQGQRYLKAWQKCTPRPMAAHHLLFAQAIEAEARKDESALILQLVEALEQSHATLWEEDDDPARPVHEAIVAGRARLEGKT